MTLRFRVIPATASILLLAILATTGVVRAETPYQKAELAYLSKLDYYRVSLTNYQTARQKYLDYQTLTAETAAITAGKTYLDSSIDLTLGYLDLVIEKANETTSISSTDKQLIVDFYNTEKAFYQNKRSAVDNAVVVASLRTISSDLNDHLKTQTLNNLPYIKDLITLNTYRAYLEETNSTFAETKNLFDSQNYLSSPTTSLIQGWIRDTDDRIKTSNELVKKITENLRYFKEPPKDQQDSAAKFIKNAEAGLLELWTNLSAHSSNLVEILGRLKNG